MDYGRRMNAWDHTAALLAQIWNSRFGAKDMSKPTDWHPMQNTKADTAKADGVIHVSITALRDVFVNRK